MIPKDCKRLAEVDFPIALVSKHSVRERFVRPGYWWARRPLAACRAMLLGLLLPDPADEHCPEEFRTQARELLGRVQRGVGSSSLELRQALLRFMGEFSNWDLAANESYLAVARGLVRAAHGEDAPLVVDPFAGGGSIPFEALRLGCEAFASDLNPVACLILKVLLEEIPRHGPRLADELRKAGRGIGEAAAKELTEFYPQDPDGGTPIAYIWARTVVCEAPGCGCEIPLVRSFWLSKKAHRRRALRFTVVRPRGERPRVEFEIFEPESEDEVPRGSISGAKAICPACHAVLPRERVSSQLAAQKGGADVTFTGGERTGGALLLAVVALREGETGRQYQMPTAGDYAAVRRAQERLHAIAVRPLGSGLSPVPDEPTPAGGGSGAGRAFSVQRYGMGRWGDLFTARQKLALCLLVQAVSLRGPERVRESLGLAFGALVVRNSVLARWRPDADQEKVETTFSGHTLPISWDFAEAVPVSRSTGSFADAIENAARTLERSCVPTSSRGQVAIADAREIGLPDAAATVWFTDPPYYDAVPYADLSDFFFVWLKRALPGHPLLADPFDPWNPLTPKAREAVQDETRKVEGRPKDSAFFEEVMGRAFAEGRRVTRDDGVGAVVFAHKTTEGWEALLSGLIRGRWTITASWPITTEMATRLRARESAALSASVHLVCRPRAEDAAVGDWTTVIRELPRRVREWMVRLQSEGVRGADLVFSCIGPALEIYSRFSKVVDAEDREIPLGGYPEAAEPHLRGYLAYVWEAVGRAALEQVLAGEGKADAGALEEDARLTALFLWTVESSVQNGPINGDEPAADAPEDDDEEPNSGKKKAKPGQKLIYDVVRRFAQPLGIHLDAWDGRIVETDKGVVRLLPVVERARQLFGEAGAQAAAQRIERARAESPQLALFPEVSPELGETEGTATRRGRRRNRKAIAEPPTSREPTTLDRVHAAMLLQRSGQSAALRTLLSAERDRGPAFERLANALSALYPEGSEEERLLDAMLLAMPR